jgi:hypothetical protein
LNSFLGAVRRNPPEGGGTTDAQRSAPRASTVEIARASRATRASNALESTRTTGTARRRRARTRTRGEPRYPRGTESGTDATPREEDDGSDRFRATSSPS